MPKFVISNIDTLLKAAEYIERKDREAEHGYASTRPIPVHYQSHRKISVNKRLKSRYNSRSSHNELEKNRRAHLRSCLDRLKSVVPLGRDMSRHTTLGLLKAAKLMIKRLEENNAEQRIMREQLLGTQRQLQHMLSQLTAGCYRVHSVSECSTSSSNFSTSSSLESEEVDIVGESFGSFQSDLEIEDQNSIDSISSDSGIVIIEEVAAKCDGGAFDYA